MLAWGLCASETETEELLSQEEGGLTTDPRSVKTRLTQALAEGG